MSELDDHFEYYKDFENIRDKNVFEYKTIFDGGNIVKESKLKKIKKVLTEIVKIGGWIIVAIEKLLEIM